MIRGEKVFRMVIALLLVALFSSPIFAQEATQYTVKPGDTLSTIAEELCGSVGKWPVIYATNKAIIWDADVILAGWELTIPKDCKPLPPPPPESVQPTGILVTGDNYPPFTCQKCVEDGMITHIVIEAFKEMGYEISDDFVTWMSWADGYQATKEARFAATFPYVWSDERREFLFSTPLYEILTKWFVRQDASLTYSETNPDGLQGAVCCQPEGYKLGAKVEDLQKQGIITFKSANDMPDCLKMLKDGEVDVIPITEFVGWGLVRKEFGSEGTKAFKTLDEPLEILELHLIVHPSYPDAKALIDKFNAAIETLDQQGTLNKIITLHLRVNEMLGE